MRCRGLRNKSEKDGVMGLSPNRGGAVGHGLMGLNPSKGDGAEHCMSKRLCNQNNYIIICITYK